MVRVREGGDSSINNPSGRIQRLERAVERERGNEGGKKKEEI